MRASRPETAAERREKRGVSLRRINVGAIPSKNSVKKKSQRKKKTRWAVPSRVFFFAVLGRRVVEEEAAEKQLPRSTAVLEINAEWDGG